MQQSTLKLIASASLAALVLTACGEQTVEEDAADAGAAGTTVEALPGTDTLASNPVDQGPILDVPENTIEYFETSVGDRVLFGTDSAVLDADDQAILTFQADWMLRYADRTATIEGHADERGTREYNLALGAHRAQAVFDYLVSLGVDPARLNVVSFGKERPVSICSDEICWSQNRRGTTVIDPAGLG